MDRRTRALGLLLVTLWLSSCGTTAPWYRGSAPSVSSSAHDGESRNASAKPEPAVRAEYDRFKDDTHLYTRPSDVAGSASLALSLHAYLHGNRTRLAKHETPLLLLGFSSRSEDSSSLEPQSCIFLIDGRSRLDLGYGSRGTRSSTDASDVLTFDVTRPIVETLLGATRIEGRLGATEFTVAPQQLAPFRELLTMIRAVEDSS